MFKRLNYDLERILNEDLVVKSKIEVLLLYLCIYVLIVYRILYFFYLYNRFFLVRLIL